MTPEYLERRQQLLVWWVLWIALFFGVFVVYYFLGIAPNAPKREVVSTPDPFIAALGLLPVGVSVVMRWAILPRIRQLQAALPVFIAGMAFAEASCYIGIFIFPAFKPGFFVFSVLGISQYIPVFAKRLIAGETKK